MSFKHSTDYWVVLFFGLWAVLSLIDIPADKSDDLEQQHVLYCQMVETYKTTGGEYGWPDYKGSYKRDCE